MSSPVNPEKPRRLFLALWPGKNDCDQMVRLAVNAARGQRRIRDELLHLTLLFLGETDATRLAAYEAALADLHIPDIELILDRYGFWPQSQILWLGSTRTPPELYELVAELTRRLRPCGFEPEDRAFQAHITLARRFSGPVPTEPPPRPFHWRINQLALVESIKVRSSVRYEILRRWPEGQ